MKWPCGIFLSCLLLGAAAPPGGFRFAILGDRTGEEQPGVFAEVWREITAEKPKFIVSVGDSIQGLDDATAEAQWADFERFRRLTLYLTPGNHDIWSAASERLYIKHSGHPPHYGFDSGAVHFTILDNSRGDQLSAGEMTFLEADLQAHAAARVKVIVSHRPSWIFPVMLKNPAFPLHALAKKYGVRYVIAGHVHQLLHFELDGVTYISAPSSGGHLRASKDYADGWFFGHLLAEVQGDRLRMRVREAREPFGGGRTTQLSDWPLR